MKSVAMIALLVVFAAIMGGQSDGQRLQDLVRSELSRLELRIQQLEDTVRVQQQRIASLEEKATQRTRSAN